MKKRAEILLNSLEQAWVELHPGGFENSKLPEFPRPHINVTIQKIKEFNAHYQLMAEFACYVCNVSLEKFCDLDMISYIINEERRKDEII